MVKFRAALGKEGVEELLAQTICAAVDMKLISPKDLATVGVDSTVQHKRLRTPRTPNCWRQPAKNECKKPRPAALSSSRPLQKKAAWLAFKAGRYAHAKQFKRMARAIKRQRTIVSRIVRLIEHGVSTLVNTHANALSQAVRVAGTRGGVHRQGQKQDTLRVWRECGHLERLK